jgi:hypothetical protein
MIFAVPISFTTGMKSVLKNVGEMSNKGIEVVINATPVKTQNFAWDLSLNMTHNVNKIEALSTDKPIINTYTIREVGYPINTFRMKEYAGADPQTGYPQWYKADGTKTGEYNEAEFRHMGSADPKVFGGFTNNFRIYDFDFSFMISYKIGGLVYNSAARYDENIGNSEFGNTTKYVYDNQWRKPGDITDVPKIVMGGLPGAGSHSSRFLMDGTYAKLKNIQVGYSLPTRFANKVQLSKVRIAFTAENLYTLMNSELRGRVIDPETGGDGILWWNYPVPQKYMFSVSLGF